MSSKEYVYIKQSIFSITVFYFNYLFFYNSVADCQFLFPKVMDLIQVTFLIFQNQKCKCMNSNGFLYVYLPIFLKTVK